jgi:hypothetical protein
MICLLPHCAYLPETSRVPRVDLADHGSWTGQRADGIRVRHAADRDPAAIRAGLERCRHTKPAALARSMLSEPSVVKKGTVTVDATRGARGSHSSMHVHIDSGSDTMVGPTETETPLRQISRIKRSWLRHSG